MFKAFLEQVSYNGILVGPSRQCGGRLMSTPITADVLYDLVNCPHRVMMDAFGDPADRDPINAFVELLWKRGTAFEDEVIADLAGKLPFVNLRPFAGAEKEQKTLEAMRAGAPLIYGGRLAADDLLGDLHLAPWSMHIEEDEKVDRPIALILAVVALKLARLGQDRLSHLTDELGMHTRACTAGLRPKRTGSATSASAHLQSTKWCLRSNAQGSSADSAASLAASR